MNRLARSLPWQFWFCWGCLSILILLKFAIWPRKNTPPAPLAWKVAWVECFFIAILVTATIYIDGTGLYTEYNRFLVQARDYNDSLPFLNYRSC